MESENVNLTRLSLQSIINSKDEDWQA